MKVLFRWLLMLGATLLATTVVHAGGAGWGDDGIDAYLQTPPAALDTGAAFAVTPDNELLVGDPAANTVAVYLDANLPVGGDDGDSYELAYTWLWEWTDIGADARAGASIVTWDTYALVGAPGEGNGRVHIMQRSGGPGTAWTETGFIDPPEPDWAGFGAAMAIDYPYLLIGAPEGSEEGVARYQISGGVIAHAYSWSSPYAAGAEFGSTVAINGTRALIGAPQADDGHALLYALDDKTGLWDMQGDYSTKSPILGRLGATVFLSDQFAAVAAPDATNPNNLGVVWLFRCTDDAPWDHEDDGVHGWAMPPASFSGGEFGASMTSWNNLLIIGHSNMTDGSGGAHVYEIRTYSPANIAAWSDSIIIEGSTWDSDWGRTLTVAGSMLWIARDDGASGYLLDDGEVRISADVAATVSAQAIWTGTDWIPQALDVEGEWMAAGSASEDQVVIMREVDNVWTVVQTLDGPESNASFGTAVRLLGGVLSIGAPFDAANDGRTYLYALDETNQWTLRQTITPDNAGNYFGFSLDTCQDHLGRLVLAVSSPAVDLSNVGKMLPTPVAAGRFDVYRIGPDADAVLLLHDWTEPGSTEPWEGVAQPAISSEGTDLIMAVGHIYRNLEDTADPPTTWGGVTIFRGGAEPASTWAIEANIEAPEGRGAFGAWTDIAAGVAVTISPFHGGDETDIETDLRIGVYEQTAPGESWVATQLLRTPDHNALHEFGGTPRLATLFGQQAVVTGSPAIQSPAGQAGSAEIFLRAGDSEYGTLFRHHLRLTVQGHHDVRLGSTCALDGDNIFFAGGLFTSSDLEVGDEGLVGWARLSDTAYWNNTFGGLLQNADNWTMDPEQADSLEISVLDPNFMMITSESESVLVDKHLHVRYAQTILHEGMPYPGGAIALDRWTMWADVGIQLATSGTSGAAVVANDLQIGHANGDAGRFWCIQEAIVTVDGTYTQAATGTLDYWFPGYFPSDPLITAANMEIGGTLSVFWPTPDDSLEVGNKFPVLRSTNAPGPDADRFDLIVLPGLANGLAMQVMYDDSGGSLVGDPWDVWIEVVELGGLLGFGDADSIGVSGTVIDLEVVDLTADGADEICVLLDGTPGLLFVFQDDGDGGVEFQYQFNTVDDPTCIASGDFNGDGYNDLAIGSHNDEVQIFWNDDADLSTGFTLESLGTIGPVTCATSIRLDGADPIDLMIGIDDVDGDGGGALQWWIGWSALQFPGGGLGGGGDQDTPGIPRGLDPSMEEDQKQHLGFVIFDNGSGGNMVGGGFVMGSFGLNVYAIGADPTGIARADLDDDGIDDIAVTSAANATVAILRGTTSGYHPALQVPLGSAPSAIVAIDFNEDGHMDLATITNNASGEPLIRVLQNEGNMQFTTIDTGGSSAPALLAAGDVDGDGTDRLVSIGGGSSLVGDTSIMSLHNVDTPICPGDIDNNGTVDVDDLMALIGQWGNDCEAGATCTADLNGNQIVDVDDLVMLIGLWGPC